MTAPCLCDLSRCTSCDEARDAELCRTFPSSAGPRSIPPVVPVGGGEKEKE